MIPGDVSGPDPELITAAERLLTRHEEMTRQASAYLERACAVDMLGPSLAWEPTWIDLQARGADIVIEVALHADEDPWLTWSVTFLNGLPVQHKYW